MVHHGVTMSTTRLFLMLYLHLPGSSAHWPVRSQPAVSLWAQWQDDNTGRSACRCNAYKSYAHSYALVKYATVLPKSTWHGWLGITVQTMIVNAVV